MDPPRNHQPHPSLPRQMVLFKERSAKAIQWEEVAATVAAGCGFEEPSKTATQCRHKIEKLRKRYRAERIKSFPNSWQYFELMDNMERGPFPLAAQPMNVVKLQQQHQQSQYSNKNNYSQLPQIDDSESDENLSYGMDKDNVRKNNKSKSINHILRGEMGGVNNTNSGNIYAKNVSRMAMMDRSYGGGSERGMMRAMREATANAKRKRYYENEDSDEEEEVEVVQQEDQRGDERGEAGDGGRELAAEIRGFAERFKRVEKKKIEMMRETERYRMEMERKRMEMILDSQRKIIDTVGRAFGTHKKGKIGQET